MDTESGAKGLYFNEFKEQVELASENSVIDIKLEWVNWEGGSGMQLLVTDSNNETWEFTDEYLMFINALYEENKENI